MPVLTQAEKDSIEYKQSLGYELINSAVDIVLTNPMNCVLDITMTTASKKLQLPPMNEANSLKAGTRIFITNTGPQDFAITPASGSPVGLTLSSNQSVIINITDNSTSDGSFSYRVLGIVCWFDVGSGLTTESASSGDLYVDVDDSTIEINTNKLRVKGATGTEIGYLSGVTSSIQTQLSEKVNKAGDTMTGALRVPELRLNDNVFESGNYLSVYNSDELTASRQLALLVNDANRLLTINGNATINDWFDQSVKTTASTTFANITATDTTDSSSKDTGAIVTEGGMGIEKKLYVGTGVYLATTGGTAAELNYYEEYSTSANTWAGAYGASPVSANITLRRIGKLVIATLPDINGTATAAASIISTEAIPARFRHSIGFFQVSLRIVNNGANQSAPGMLHVKSDGLFEIFINGLGNTFTGANGARVYPATASWVV